MGFLVADKGAVALRRRLMGDGEEVRVVENAEAHVPRSCPVRSP